MFIVILWKCSKNPQWQSATVVGAVGSVVNAQRCPSFVVSHRLSTSIDFVAGFPYSGHTPQ
jgi:hypothetical protein